MTYAQWSRQSREAMVDELTARARARWERTSRAMMIRTLAYEDGDEEGVAKADAAFDNRYQDMLAGLRKIAKRADELTSK